MSAIDLTQAEADELMSVDKHRISDEAVPYPAPGQNITIELRSTDNREEFLLDVWRSDKNPRRARFQIRAKRAIILARIDLGGPPHSFVSAREGQLGNACSIRKLYRSGRSL